VFVDAAHGLVFADDGRLWRGAGYLRDGRAIEDGRRRILSGDSIPEAGEPLLVACATMHANYFHWHLDCLPGLVLAREHFGSDIPPIHLPALAKWQSASLALLNPPAVRPAAGLVRTSEAIVPCYLDGRGVSPDRRVGRMFDILTAEALARVRPDRARPRRILVSRSDATHRKLEDEDELFAALQGEGFERIRPAEFGYLEQVATFRAAEIVVGMHGAGLTSIGFCRPGTHVFEIVPPDYLNGCFRSLAMLRSLRHAWFVTDAEAPLRANVPEFMAFFRAGMD
jgi:capsular polysaccharide biosynthesis protein